MISEDVDSGLLGMNIIGGLSGESLNGCAAVLGAECADKLGAWSK